MLVKLGGFKGLHEHYNEAFILWLHDGIIQEKGARCLKGKLHYLLQFFGN